MRKSTLACSVAGFIFLAMPAGLLGASRKPGLWKYTTKTTWQKAPRAQGNQPMQLGGEHTREVCLTEALIDQYGFLLPQSRGQCAVENKQVQPGHVTADYVCNGRMNGKGELDSTWSDPEHMLGTLHFAGTMLVGSETQTIEWTTESKAEFKSSDCGSIAPLAPPKGRP